VKDKTIDFEFVDDGAYLVATIQDTTVNSQRARKVLESIDSECQKYGCRKVLLDELALESRNIAGHEIYGISDIIPNIYLAIQCKPELIDNHAKLFSALTFADGYMVRHFSIKDEAIEWLMSKRGS